MNKYIPNIPKTKRKRIVIVGGGFAGLKLLRKLLSKGFQIVFLDKNNFHQFQPLLYQVATSGLEPSSISFPFRKILQKEKDVHFRIAELKNIMAESNTIETNIGLLEFDYLVLSMGAATNYFGLQNIESKALSMKTASDAILIRNTVLQNFELSLLETEKEKIEKYLNVVLVGGGPTGVELAGALAEMKRYIFPKEYPELDLSMMRIVLYEASSSLLAGMSENASDNALKYLEKLGVEVFLNSQVTDYKDNYISLKDGSKIVTKTVIWAAGVKVNDVEGLNKKVKGRSNRIKVDRYNKVEGYQNIFALGDLCIMETPKFPSGHSQLAQPAIQQAENLARNIVRIEQSKDLKEFEYNDKGSMATIGRNLAVADLPGLKLKGFVAWVLWLFVHLMSIVGIKNRLLIFLNWLWSYFTYDQSLRVLIKPKIPKVDKR